MEPKRKGRKPKQATLDADLKAEVDKLAQEILFERQYDSRRIAAIEVQNRLLQQVIALQNIVSSGQPVVQAESVKPAPVTNACCICGRAGMWRNPRGGAWHCKVHASEIIRDNKEEALSGGLLGALKQAKPIDDASLPA